MPGSFLSSVFLGRAIAIASLARAAARHPPQPQILPEKRLSRRRRRLADLAISRQETLQSIARNDVPAANPNGGNGPPPHGKICRAATDPQHPRRLLHG